MTVSAAVKSLEHLLARYAFRFATEKQLHDGISKVLTDNGVDHQREVIDGPNRYDFLCASVVIEVKIDGSASEALRQVDRYCESARVQGVILATTKGWKPDAFADGTCRGKPVVIARIRGQVF